MDRWKEDVHNLSTADLQLCRIYLEQRLAALPESGARAERTLLTQRVVYVKRELELRSDQLELPLYEADSR